MKESRNRDALESSLLLDSSLITATNLKRYNIKIVDCGYYKQIYLYDTYNIKNIQKEDFDLKLKKERINQIFNESINKNKCIDKSKTNNDLKQIEIKNITRSKLQCQRLAKSNVDKWQTFITLTFDENLIDIKEANKKFHSFITQVKRAKNDFSYIAIPEFQKRGAVHYHLLTNIEYSDRRLLFEQEDNPKFIHIKYWNHGFTSVELMKGDCKKVVGYVSKYMTKDIDNRLFGRRRYFYSQNLRIPKESFVDTDVDFELNYYKKIIQGKELIYQNEYINPYNGTKVIFLELSCPYEDSIT